ncbi:MAG: RNA polymerase sigma factor [Oscillospiraceae bacterium]|nr:RNA polymerase sigma factor [Oscillospiraceae bacterium]
MEDDARIIGLFEQRSEQAIAAVSGKYGGLCRSIAGRILSDTQDVEECVNDTWLRLWNAIPPAKPDSLGGFITTVVRRLCFDRLDASQTAKRGGGQLPLALEELAYCMPSQEDVAHTVEQRELSAALERFLDALPYESRTIFVMRYGNLYSIREIAEQYGISESKVKVTLHRARKKLKTCMEQEGLL